MKIIKASLDRFEDDVAIIYSDEESDKRFDVPRKLVSIDVTEGSRVRLFLEEDNSVLKVDIDERRTEESRNRIKRKFQRLLKGEHV